MYTLNHIFSNTVSGYPDRKLIISVFPAGCVLVAPDKGATAKVAALANLLQHRWIQGDKVRDPKTGALSGFSVDDDGKSIEGCHLVVVDDICDGGGTFIGLGEELNKLKPKSMDLYVTHGIFSKGYDKLLEIYTTIHTTDTFIRNHPKVINVLNILKDV
jgi:ribose-phosphate pyrophosphokinase